MRDASPLILTPYAVALGVTVARDMPDGEPPVLQLPFAGLVEGRPGAMHGGAISGLLETAGYAALRAALGKQATTTRLKPINITVQFLSAGKPRMSFAQGHIVRLGRRNANIAVAAWQEEAGRPIATAVMNVLMVGEGRQAGARTD